MTDWLHAAAREGNTHLLKQVSARDANCADEDGMTATLWAAYCGHLDSLRALVGRGGDPDLCDHYGNTALHCAAAMCHLSCVTFLVNFGVRVFALDNDLHSAKNLAEIRGHRAVYLYLDDVIARREQDVGAKKTRALREKALGEAQKRIHNYDRRLKRHDKKIQQKETRKTTDFTQFFSRSKNSTISKKSIKILNLSKNSADSMSIAESNSQVLYCRSKNDNFSSHSSDKGSMTPGHSLFERPGFGSVSFRSSISASLSSISEQNITSIKKLESAIEQQEEDVLATSHVPTPDTAVLEDSLVSCGFESHSPESFCWKNSSSKSEENLAEQQANDDADHGDDDVEDDGGEDDEEDRENARMGLASLHLFLSAAGVAEFSPNFQRERIDLAALMLLDDSDLASLGLPLGPRRKLLHSIAQRSQCLQQPGPIYDTHL